MDFEATSRGRKEEEWHSQQTGSDGKPTEIYSQEERIDREEAATPPVDTTDVPKLSTATCINQGNPLLSSIKAFIGRYLC